MDTHLTVKSLFCAKALTRGRHRLNAFSLNKRIQREALPCVCAQKIKGNILE
ncbi:hypothetical protein PJE062_4476 [Pseudovibrio sp. JE062]|nr:hypothetical protein PJE062_4476 [Pseudovibrio sp. JE062]